VNASPARDRWRVGAALVVVIALGLLSRRFPLPGVFAEYTGDALYTVAAFCALAWLAPTRRSTVLAGAAFGFSGVVECSQLLSWQWLVDLRRSPLGALVLGQGFQWEDFLAYGAGAVGAFLLDGLARRAGRTPIFGRAPGSDRLSR